MKYFPSVTIFCVLINGYGNRKQQKYRKEETKKNLYDGLQNCVKVTSEITKNLPEMIFGKFVE